MLTPSAAANVGDPDRIAGAGADQLAGAPYQIRAKILTTGLNILLSAGNSSVLSALSNSSSYAASSTGVGSGIAGSVSWLHANWMAR